MEWKPYVPWSKNRPYSSINGAYYFNVQTQRFYTTWRVQYSCTILCLQITTLFYWRAENDSLEKAYLPGSPDDYSGLLWCGGSTTVPSGIPACGWDGELCVEDETSAYYTMIAGKRVITLNTWSTLCYNILISISITIHINATSILLSSSPSPSP